VNKKQKRPGDMPPERQNGPDAKAVRERRAAARAAEQPSIPAASARAWKAVVRNGLI
jgi:hypothetical protein